MTHDVSFFCSHVIHGVRWSQHSFLDNGPDGPHWQFHGDPRGPFEQVHENPYEPAHVKPGPC